MVLADRSNLKGDNTMLGDLLCLISASFYACYTIAIRRLLSDDKHTNTMLFFGYVGALNAVCLAPLLVILQLAGKLKLTELTTHILLLTVMKGACSWPNSEGEAFQGANKWCSAGLLDNVLSDYLWARAVLLVGESRPYSVSF